MIDYNLYKLKFDEKKCCVIIPTYNNSDTLDNVIKGVLKFTTNIIIVNDGSNDSTNVILKKYNNFKIINFSKNRGKGSAIKEGFKTALKLNFEYAITIDSDGQHNSDDLYKFIDKIEELPKSIIIGNRNMNRDGIPRKSSFGNKFSNFWFWIETGYKMPDTQSGFRLYPILLMKNIRFYTNRFEFEIESIVKSVWKGIHISSVDISIYYAPESERISHFRPFTDFARISILNTYLVMISLFYHLILRFISKLTKDNIKQFFKNQLLNKEESNLKKSVSVAFGIFMGIVPIWGYQMIIALALSVIMKLNKMIVLVAANISIPPMIPFILFGSYLTGAWVLGNDVNEIFRAEITFEYIKNNIFQYIIGSIIFAIISGILIGLITFILLHFFNNKVTKKTI